VNTGTIEQLQRIVSDENRTEQERRQAAEHILKLQESNQEPVAPADKEEADRAMVRGIFDDLLDLDGSKARERQRIEDQTMHVCGACFTLQPRANVICELCGGSEVWLVPSQARSNAEYLMFINMAANHSVEQLRVALHSGWSHTPQRERVARLLLVSREARLHSQEANVHTECTATEDRSRSVLDGIDLNSVASYYDYRLAQLQAEQDRLEQQEHQVSTTSASAS
jgi:hypothetical protein